MSLAKAAIDILGVGIEIYISFLFYGIFWEMKRISKRFLVASASCIGAVNLVIFLSSWGTYVHLIIFVLVRFLFTLYFKSGISSKVLFALALSALDMVIELTAGVVMSRTFSVTIEDIQGNLITYAVGLFSAKLLILTVTYLIKLLFPLKNRQGQGMRFDLLMLFLPAQSLVLCFVIYGMTAFISDTRVNFLSMVALCLSFLLLVTVAFIIKNLLESAEYKQKYELSQTRLSEQIKHYKDLYSAGREIRGIKHDMKNHLTIIAGLLKDEGSNKAALGYIEKIQSGIEFADKTTDTGMPAIDAILSAKINEAAANKIEIKYKIIIDGKLYIDQSDIAIILANALDNALEAVVKSKGIDTCINVHISSASDYISVIVENHTSQTMDKELKTTKSDKNRHGFGIWQMSAVAKKYDGILTTGFDPKTQKFSLKVLLRNRSA